MLCRLSVENYALIDRLDIEFAAGLNIITGETGAGKSILLGALGLILGNRTDASAIKAADRNCVVEGEFDIRGYGLEPLFGSLDIDYDERTLVRRVITPAGKSRAYVNDLPVQLSALREIGSRLIDIHSQHQTLLLGDNRFQTGILDGAASHGALLARYGEAFGELSAARRELSELERKAGESERDREYVAFQFAELQEARLRAGEQQELESLYGELSHASEIKDTLLFASQELDGADDSLLARLKVLETSLGRLGDVYPRANEFFTRLHSSLLDLKDMASEIASEGDRLEADPGRLESTGARLDRLYALQQKHRVSSEEELLSLREEYGARLAGIEGYAQAISELKEKIGALQTRAAALARQITDGRLKAAPSISEQAERMLSELGMPAAQLKIDIAPSEELQADGADSIRFLFTANRNMAPQPIEKVASGGEMSRLMLSLKALMARHGKLPTIIFDEIDTGVSGQIADRMGGIIARLAETMQVINITHLPQVASKGDHHFFVYKEDTGQATATRIRLLTHNQRVAEIAKMLSGSDVTEAALQQARLLLGDQAKK